jgi:mycofactocin precursor
MTQRYEQSLSDEATGRNEVEPEARDEVSEPLEEALVEAELLLEDVSIDGMCGVY